jgi:hypothetical protein
MTQNTNSEAGSVAAEDHARLKKASEFASIELAKRMERNRRAKANRRAREDALKSCGLVKVRGALGGVYWE